MEVQSNSRYGALVKRGNNGSGSVIPPGMIPGINDTTQGASMDARVKANRQIWQMLAAGLGLGLLTRGGLGLSRMLMPQSDYTPEPSFQSVDVMTPGDDEEKRAGWASDKVSQLSDKIEEARANWPKTGPFASVGSFFNPREWAGTTENWFTQPRGGVGGMFFGEGMTNPSAIPAKWAIGLPLMLGGFGGSYMLADKILDRRRKAELEGRERAAKKEYEQLLTELMAQKHASADNIEDALDELAELCCNPLEKQANPNAIDRNAPASSLYNIPGAGMSLLATYAILSALTSGKISYDYFRKRSPQNVTEEALRRRSKERTGGMAPLQLNPGTGLV